MIGFSLNPPERQLRSSQSPFNVRTPLNKPSEKSFSAATRIHKITELCLFHCFRILHELKGSPSQAGSPFVNSFSKAARANRLVNATRHEAIRQPKPDHAYIARAAQKQ